MAVRDIEAFVRERAARYDSNIDLSSGSPFDTQVIQPLVRRLGTDPFTVDISAFLESRLRQAFPDMALDEGDAMVDLLVKPVTLLWDPVVREISRVKQNLSFQDPTVLNLEEAEALGANLFAERTQGVLARGVGRLSFAQPQSVTISPINYATSKSGIRFFPSEAQTIRMEEMLLNLAADGTYYFDVNLVAENPGDKYNIGPGELSSIANVESAVKVTNTRRFRDGVDEETAEEFIDKARGELTERSLVTTRGISAQLTKGFPEIRRLNVIGNNDPEMMRDIITGGSVGAVYASGIDGIIDEDGSNQLVSRRFAVAAAPALVDFTSLIGPTTVQPIGFVLTVINGINDPSVFIIQDFNVTKVLSASTIEVDRQVLDVGRLNLSWALRRREIALSGIPGGILFPNAAGGLTIPEGVHVGGCTDVYVGGTGFDDATLLLSNVTDDLIELQGGEAQPTSAIPRLTLALGGPVDGVVLADLVLGTGYAVNDDTYRLLDRAGKDGLTLQIVTGPNTNDFGVYRILRAHQESGFPTELQVIPTPPVLDGLDYHWRIFDRVNIDLTDPKETRISGDKLVTVQGQNNVTTTPSTNFNDYGVAQGDVLRILSGPDVGDYTLTDNPQLSGTSLPLDVAIKNTASNLKFTVFRPLATAGLNLPLVRIKEIELLDSSNQPLGSKIPYANPVDVQSRAFQNPARGVKKVLQDVRLGILTSSVLGSPFFLTPAASTINVTVMRRDGTISTAPAVFPLNATKAQVISLLNGALTVALGAPVVAAFDFATLVPGDLRVAIKPVGVGVILTGLSTAMTPLFGNGEPRTSADIRSDTVEVLGGWDSIAPAVDFATGLDLIQFMDGHQVGFYPAPYSGPASTLRSYQPAPSAAASTALMVRDVLRDHDETTRQFSPEVGVRAELGARSLGSARCFFLDPTTIEFNQDSFFSIDTDLGTLRFLPDPTLDTQLIPPMPSDDKTNDGLVDTTTPTLFSAATQNFLNSGVVVGDKLLIDFVPLRGTVMFTVDPVANLSNIPGVQPAKNLVFTIDSGPELTLTFIKDDPSIANGEVTLQGVADQINAKAGRTICSIYGSTPTAQLEFEADVLISIKSTGTANPVILGNVDGTGGAQSFTSNQDNQSPNFGEYIIKTVGTTTLTLEQVPPLLTNPFISVAPYTGTTLGRQGFRVMRAGTQRISTTQMALQIAEASLYYFDVELVSEGTGDVWNIAAAKQLFVKSFRSDGYTITNLDNNMTFSILERPQLSISKSILENGVDDDPNNTTQIAGQNLQITYERSQLVADVQSFVTSVAERVTLESMLARHLIPHFVRVDINYTGGSAEDLVTTDLVQYTLDRFPADPLEASDLQKIVTDRGANYVKNPLDIIAVVHNIDRTVQAARSQDSLTTGRLAAFIPDILNVVRKTT